MSRIGPGSASQGILFHAASTTAAYAHDRDFLTDRLVTAPLDELRAPRGRFRSIFTNTPLWFPDIEDLLDWEAQAAIMQQESIPIHFSAARPSLSCAKR